MRVIPLPGYRTKTPAGEVVLSRLRKTNSGFCWNAPANPRRHAARRQTELNAPLTVAGPAVTASIGIALNSSPQEKAENLLRDSEDAMRRAKAMGARARTIRHSYTGGQPVKAETDLRSALDHNQFIIHYQPIHQMETRRIVSAEALVRWHPEQGLISLQVHEAAEDTGLIALIDRWVIWQACRQMYQWQCRYPFVKPLSVTVNISGRHLTNPHLVPEIKSCIRDTGIEPSRLQLEVARQFSHRIPTPRALY